MTSKTRAVENFIMTSRLVNIRLGDTYYIHVLFQHESQSIKLLIVGGQP